MVNKKVICELDDMSIDKSLNVVYNISKDDRLKSMVMTTAAEIVGIRLGEKSALSPDWSAIRTIDEAERRIL